MKLRKIFLIILLHYSFGQLVRAQQSAVMDSLKLVFKSARHDSTRCNTLNAMIEAESDDNIWPQYNEQLKTLCETNLKKYSPGSTLHNFYMKHMAAVLNNKGYLANMRGDIKYAVEYYEKGLAIDEKLGNKQGIATSLNNLGSLYQYQGEISKAIECYNKSLGLRTEIKDKLGMAVSYNNIGLIYNEQGDISKALDYYHKSLNISEEIGDKKEMAAALNNIGTLYQHQEDTARALKFYNRSLKILKEINDKFGIASALHNIGHIYRDRGDTLEALNSYEKSLKISEELGSKSGMAHCLNSIGAVYSAKNNIFAALDYWQRSLKLMEEINDKQGIILSLNHVATAFIKLKEEKKAREYSERSLKLAKELGYPEEIGTASGILYKIYSKAGDWKRAYEMLTLHKQMSDTLNEVVARKVALQKSFQYEYEKKTTADSIKAVEERKVFNAQIKQEKTQRNALYFSITLITLFALFMYNRFRVTRKQKQIIELKEKETQEQKLIIEEKHKEISDSINYAERIQRSFLATKELLDKNLNSYFILFKPKAIVSGDFYWAAKLNNGHFVFAIADSTGHGVPGAIMSLLNITSLEKAIEHYTDPGEILNHTRQTIIDRLKKDGSDEGGKDGMDCGLMVFDFKNNLLKVAAANNPIWIIRKENNIPELVQTGFNNMPVGKHERDQISFTTFDYQLRKEDMIYAITDGFADQFGGPKGKKFMHKKLKELLISISHENPEKQKEILTLTLKEWIGELEQIDDITIVGIRV
jgi:tetratricopeptide (TPR) repeat protein/serine phosphatase RsbU (regulator of sigma subunit)